MKVYTNDIYQRRMLYEHYASLFETMDRWCKWSSDSLLTAEIKRLIKQSEAEIQKARRRRLNFRVLYEHYADLFDVTHLRIGAKRYIDRNRMTRAILESIAYREDIIRKERQR